MQITPLANLRAPLGGEDIELQEVLHDAGGMKLLRVRIRERKRFTIIDIDPATARAWGAAMERWAAAQPGADAGTAP
jgi:Family of unknown function (DUF6967)